LDTRGGSIYLKYRRYIIDIDIVIIVYYAIGSTQQNTHDTYKNT